MVPFIRSFAAAFSCCCCGTSVLAWTRCEIEVSVSSTCFLVRRFQHNNGATLPQSRLHFIPFLKLMRFDGDKYNGKADHPRCPAAPGLYVFVILQQAFVLLAFVCIFTKTTIDDITAQQRFLHDFNKSRGDVLISQELLPACGSPLSARGGGANFPPTGVSTRRVICNSKLSCGTTEALPDANDN